MNPPEQPEKTNFGTPALSLVHPSRAILQAIWERRLMRVLEPAMMKMLVATLMTACAVNMACLVGHFSP